MQSKIENDIPLPITLEKVKKSRGRRAVQSKKKANPAADLIAALKFISMAQKKSGNTQLQFCHIAHNWVAASNGILTIAHPIQEDLYACAHTFQFLNALNCVTDDMAITQLSADALAVSSCAFRGLVVCVDAQQVPIDAPDDRLAAYADDRIKAALGVACRAVGGQYDAVLLQSGSAVGTSGQLLIEHWHGINLPRLLIPVSSAMAVAKSPYCLSGFGFSNNSVTFYFENGSWVKTKLSETEFPAYDTLFDVAGDTFAISEDFFNAIAAIKPFSNRDTVVLQKDEICSHVQQTESSTYNTTLPISRPTEFNSKLIMSLKELATSIIFDRCKDRLIFFGENTRGALIGFQATTGLGLPDFNIDYDADVPF